VIRVTVAALALLSLAGCGQLRADEVAFHVLNTADMAQSINAISRDCFHEGDAFTSRILGDKPSSGEFALFGAAVSLGFHAFNRLDYVQERPKLRLAVNLLAIGAKGWQVAHNHDIGMRVSGSNPGCAP